MHVLHTLQQARRLQVRVVIRVRVDFQRRDLEVSVWSQVLVRLSEQPRVVADAAFEFATVDVVEVLAVVPVLLEVVDLEATVGWDPGRLDGT